MADDRDDDFDRNEGEAAREAAVNNLLDRLPPVAIARLLVGRLDASEVYRLATGEHPWLTGSAEHVESTDFEETPPERG